MNAKVIETEVSEDGIIHIQDKELKPGKVEIIILTREVGTQKEFDKIKNNYPLRGTPIRYDNPTEPVAESDWEVLK